MRALAEVFISFLFSACSHSLHTWGVGLPLAFTSSLEQVSPLFLAAEQKHEGAERTC